MLQILYKNLFTQSIYDLAYIGAFSDLDCIVNYKVVAGQGLEPQLTAPEAVVLPLDDPASTMVIISEYYQIFKQILIKGIQILMQEQYQSTHTH